MSTAGSAERVDIGRFSAGALAAWQEKSFKGKTDYRLTGTGNHRALEARCDGTASAIARLLPVDLNATPVLHWQWRVENVHEGLDEHGKAGDDFAARVYVIHDAGLLKWRSRAINYVWAGSAERGSHWPNPFTHQAMMVAVESGATADPHAWVSESRDVRADFKRFYDLDLDSVDAVAIMTDCDNAGGTAGAAYRDLYFAPK
ncbi:DUF3047 domain-containing protein [Salinisphaera aquimarina]|uniref:DUF3047 domain-containing protein n=1 Tax=Salinisphaera aquimarina TaxID=2094031 RepID=A0ABV7ELV1_9GAMM